MSDELTRLADLHSAGKLTDDEFAQAKRKVLSVPQMTESQFRSTLATQIGNYVELQREKFHFGRLFQWIVLIIVAGYAFMSVVNPSVAASARPSSGTFLR